MGLKGKIVATQRDLVGQLSPRMEGRGGEGEITVFILRRRRYCKHQHTGYGPSNGREDYLQDDLRESHSDHKERKEGKASDFKIKVVGRFSKRKVIFHNREGGEGRKGVKEVNIRDAERSRIFDFTFNPDIRRREEMKEKATMKFETVLKSRSRRNPFSLKARGIEGKKVFRRGGGVTRRECHIFYKSSRKYDKTGINAIGGKRGTSRSLDLLFSVKRGGEGGIGRKTGGLEKKK